MPSQSRSDGETIPDHWIWIGSPDFVKVFGVAVTETGEDA